jgi:hypothetical protein
MMKVHTKDNIEQLLIYVGTVVGLPFIMPNTTSLISIGHLSYKDRFQMN